jgi:hypothetical protein
MMIADPLDEELRVWKAVPVLLNKVTYADSYLQTPGQESGQTPGQGTRRAPPG